MKVDAKCDNCGGVSSLNIPDDKAGAGKNIDVQWRCKGCARQNLYKLRNSSVGADPTDQPRPNKEHGKCYTFMAKHPCLKYVLCICLPIGQALCIFCLINEEDGGEMR
eukprot:TRINITY_DN46479_c0_g1_i2.p1 TRINITY_DN46479_c0_g1~~TRINITY_DN46479_c0_g1_i2.p1  ORF type:complete len:108 (-),score=11.83 TRINITY_DN46479_c0_g1_i2:128-451(-)